MELGKLKPEDKREGALSAYRVLDLTDQRGMLCGQILSELGADVIKVEPPCGDAGRNIGPFYHDEVDPEKSLYWFAVNAGKRGITLDIETADGREILKELLKKADFLIESFRPGYMDSIGLGYDELSRLNSGLVMTSITPFGQTGPWADYQADDIVLMATGGMVYVCGDRDRPPTTVSVEQAYLLGGLHAASGTMIANYYRGVTGNGQHVDSSIHESVAWHVTIEHAFWEFHRVAPARMGQKRVRTDNPTLVIYPCKDGQVAFWLLYGKYGRWFKPLADWMEEEGLAGPLKEVENWDELDATTMTVEKQEEWQDAFTNFFLRHTKRELFEEALKRGFIICPSNTIKDLFEFEQFASREFFVDVEHPELNDVIKYPRAPYRLSETSCHIRRRAPFLGEHNQEIYGEELGYDNKRLRLLKEIGVI
jgi:crotonobetainyl-CoA:carnitine CoA-transferase CaiB-like acyl-CoA transferase